MTQEVNKRRSTMESWFPAQDSPCGICGGRNGNGSGFPHCSCYSTRALYLSIHRRRCRISWMW